MRCGCRCHTKNTKANHCSSCQHKHTSCAICSSEENITEHHLIPKAIGTDGKVVKVCRYCHNLIHETFTHRQLANKYNNIEKILESKVFTSHLRNAGVITVNH